ncbi:MAG: AI-2E family transporter [Acidobacteria bacterium]|nr:AI-2E family transporter [Acidobacteriota bacterium]
MAEREIVKEAAEGAAIAAVQASGPQTRAIVRVVFIALIILLGVLGAIFILRALTSVLLLVVLAIFFAYLISPLVEFVSRPFNMRGQKRIMPRSLAIGIVYLFLFGSIGIATYVLLPRLGNQITEFAAQAPTYLTSAKARAQKMNEFYQAYNLPKVVRDKATEWLANLIGTVGEYTTNGIGNVLLEVIYLLPWLILIPILAFFLLKDADSFRRSALQMLPSGRWRWRGDEFFQDVNRTLAAYIRAQLIACLFIGTVCTIAFLIIGVPYALLFGIMAALFEFVPLVGPLTVAAVVTPITGFYSIRQAMVVLLFLAVLRIVHDYVIYPRIIGQGIHLHPLAVILAILCGAELAGIAGIFLAIPVVAITTVTYRHWLEHRGSAGLVADLLKPEGAAQVRAEIAAMEAEPPPPAPLPAPDGTHPTRRTTPEEMARVRPDLTSGELKMPKLD